jgi:hypothetical protein
MTGPGCGSHNPAGRFSDRWRGIQTGAAAARARRDPFRPTDVLRTVLRRVLPQFAAIDQDRADAVLLAESSVLHPQSR